MVRLSPANFFEFLPGSIYEQVRFWSKLAPHEPRNSGAYITASFADGLVFDLSEFSTHYKTTYFNKTLFTKNSHHFARNFAGTIRDRAARHEIKSLHINITIRCDELEAVFPVHIRDSSILQWPPVG